MDSSQRPYDEGAGDYSGSRGEQQSQDPSQNPQYGEYSERSGRDTETREERRARREIEKAERRRRRAEEGGERSSSRGIVDEQPTSTRGISDYNAPLTGHNDPYAPPSGQQYPGAFPGTTPPSGQYGDQSHTSYNGNQYSAPPPPPPQAEYPHQATYGGSENTYTPSADPSLVPHNRPYSDDAGYAGYPPPPPPPPPGPMTGMASSSNYPPYQPPQPGTGEFSPPPLYQGNQPSSFQGPPEGRESYQQYSSTYESDTQHGRVAQPEYASEYPPVPPMPAPASGAYGYQSEKQANMYNTPGQEQYGQPSYGADFDPTSHMYPVGAVTSQATELSKHGYGAPQMSEFHDEVPRNPSTCNYNPKPFPAGPLPTAPVPYTRIQQANDYTGYQAYEDPTPKKSIFSNFPSMLHTALHDIARDFTSSSAARGHHHSHVGSSCTHPDHLQTEHRFNSFAGVRRGNNAKWFVDGKDYMYAVSTAIEQARVSIWILDWWLSPELYLRRPGAFNEQYRLDRMLQAAAQRGVKINVIVYKEVEKALTLDSMHTKHALEALHPTNIAVFRHPDHLIQGATVAQNLTNTIEGKVSLQSAFSGAMSLDDQITLYWAHHEKLCLIDGDIPGEGIAFMGGLDLCWGRWDMWHHPISDVHPGDVKETLFIGQDYNNARIMDFHNVNEYLQNKLDRTQSSRMGWSDVALCLTGPSVDDLKVHFVDRWNFIFNEKARSPVAPVIEDLRELMLIFTKPEQYQARRQDRYKPMALNGMGINFDQGLRAGATNMLKGKMRKYADKMRNEEARFSGGGGGGDSYYRGGDPGRGKDRGISSSSHKSGHYHDPLAFGDTSSSSDDEEDYRRQGSRGMSDQTFQQDPSMPTGMQCQIVRSASMWSNGTKTEHSVQNAYIEIINAAQFFVYIENQFFITITGPENGPVKNKIGEAIVNRIVRAHQNREKFRMIVCMPSVPAFAGDLKDESSLGTRAIMEFQYNGICRGSKLKGSSIMEKLSAQGINPYDYIRFYNLRSYDRINISKDLVQGEHNSGVSYDAAQSDLESKYGANWQTGSSTGGELNQWNQQAPGIQNGSEDSVAKCAMLGGGDVRDAAWTGDPEKEIDAYVSEELYIHTKLLIADDRIVICGSANLNDRSQLGDHDSEIAIIIEDPSPLGSLMNDRPYPASHYAATLRRQIFRKHLGLLPAQNLHDVDDNMKPVPAPNLYDYDSREDDLVMDPLSDRLWDFWDNTAKTNTDAFAKCFHAVPYDGVRNWKDYDEYFGKYFHKREFDKAPLHKWGHIVREEFPPGVEGVRIVKNVLSRIRGNLVTMPLHFLEEEDIARESLSLNALTEEIYT